MKSSFLRLPGLLVLVALSPLLQAGNPGSRVLYAGGTVAGLTNKTTLRIEVREADGLAVSTKENSFQIPYKDINTLEYGLRVSRRYLEAVLISPMFLLAKKKT